ncbi:hypothetical protein [Luteipulveratus mongoliensis]|nr:hypothetical protein [Luteipulveratus mongoliensis]
MTRSKTLSILLVCAAGAAALGMSAPDAAHADAATYVKHVKSNVPTTPWYDGSSGSSNSHGWKAACNTFEVYENNNGRYHLTANWGGGWVRMDDVAAGDGGTTCNP